MTEPTVKLYLGDCLDVLPSLERVRLAFFDGPYALGKANWDILTLPEYVTFYRHLLAVAKPTLLQDSSMYLCGVAPQIHYLTPVVQEFFDWRAEIIWVINNPQGTGVDSWVRATETILFATQGSPPFNKDTVRVPHLEHYQIWGTRYLDSTVERATAEIRKGSPYQKIGNKFGYRTHPLGRACENVWMFQVPHGAVAQGGRTGHIAEKPTKLVKRVILASSNVGDIVLDPFMGSGTTGVACIQLGRSFIGIEIDPTYYAIAEKRIAEAQAQPLLPTFRLTSVCNRPLTSTQIEMDLEEHGG